MRQYAWRNGTAGSHLSPKMMRTIGLAATAKAAMEGTMMNVLVLRALRTSRLTRWTSDWHRETVESITGWITPSSIAPR